MLGLSLRNMVVAVFLIRAEGKLVPSEFFKLSEVTALLPWGREWRAKFFYLVQGPLNNLQESPTRILLLSIKQKRNTLAKACLQNCRVLFLYWLILVSRSILPVIRSIWESPSHKKFNVSVNKQYDKQQCKSIQLDGKIVSSSLCKQVTPFDLKLTPSVKDCFLRRQKAPGFGLGFFFFFCI